MLSEVAGEENQNLIIYRYDAVFSTGCVASCGALSLRLERPGSKFNSGSIEFWNLGKSLGLSEARYLIYVKICRITSLIFKVSSRFIFYGMSI